MLDYIVKMLAFTMISSDNKEKINPTSKKFDVVRAVAVYGLIIWSVFTTLLLIKAKMHSDSVAKDPSVICTHRDDRDEPQTPKLDPKAKK